MPKWLKGAGRRPLFKLIGHCSLTWCGSRWSRLFKWFCRGQVSPAIHEDKAANKMQKCNYKTELVDCLTLQHLIIIRPIIDLFIWPIKFKFSWLDTIFFFKLQLADIFWLPLTSCGHRAVNRLLGKRLGSTRRLPRNTNVSVQDQQLVCWLDCNLLRYSIVYF